jgi:hypothetical protein
MKQFTVKIWAYEHYAKFNIFAENNANSLEQSILDKLGEKSINWEYLGNSYDDRVNRITYEEVIEDGTTSARPLHEEERSGPRMGAGSS